MMLDWFKRKPRSGQVPKQRMPTHPPESRSGPMLGQDAGLALCKAFGLPPGRVTSLSAHCTVGDVFTVDCTMCADLNTGELDFEQFVLIPKREQQYLW